MTSPTEAAAAPDERTPYAGLSPHVVLDALDAVGLRGDGRLLQLNSYENRVFQVHLEDGPVVVAKFYRAGRWRDEQILEEHGFAHELAAAEVPAVAPLALHAVDPDARVSGTPGTLAHWQGWRYGVSPRCGGRSPELDDLEVLAWIGRFLGRLHAVGRQGRFRHRPVLDGAGPARAAVDWLATQDLLPPGGGDVWASVARQALDMAQARFDAVTPALQRLHGDCHVGNLLWTPAGPHFVDLDDCLSGPAVQDLWMLLSGSRQEMQRQLGALLDGYETFAELDRRELALIEPLRTLRLVQHCAWVAKRWDDPAFPVAFPGFANPSWWEQQATQLREQLEAMSDEPLVA